MKTMFMIALLFSPAAFANPEHLFTCALNGGGTVAVYADADMQLGMLSMDSAALAQLPPGTTLPKYFRVTASTGDAKGGFKGMGLYWDNKSSDQLLQLKGINNPNMRTLSRFFVSFSKDVRAGKALTPGEELKFSDKADMAPKMEWSVYDSEKAALSGATYINVKTVAISRCVVGQDLKSTNEIEQYLTR